MTLRVRLVLLSATVVSLAAITIGFGAYVIAGSRLQAEVDHALDTRVNSIERAVQESTNPGFRDPRRDQQEGDPLLQSRFDVLTQVIDKDGNILAADGRYRLTPDGHDMNIATEQVGRHRWTITIDGTKYRGVTEGLTPVGAVMVAREISDITAAQNSMRWWFLGLGLGTIAIATLLAWQIARKTAKPIEELAVATAEITRTQDTSKSIEVRSSGEIRHLTDGFNSMLSALNLSRMQQQQLVQDASHELRTPLTSLRANAEILTRHDLDESTRQEILRDIQAEVDELTALASELTALATDQRKEEDVTEVSMTEIADLVASRASRRTGRAVTVTSDNPAEVRVRASQFDRALSNLVDNALKFSPENTAVEIHINRYRIAVQDQGPGISDDDAPKVFDRFFRSVSTRTAPGSGLGLAIVSQFAQDHNATTFIERGDDGGAIVGLVFPSDPSSWASPIPHQAQ